MPGKWCFPIALSAFFLFLLPAVAANGCHVGQNGTLGYCSEECKCARGEGDCDFNSECEAGLLCRDDTGAYFGFPPMIDVCLPIDFSPEEIVLPSVFTMNAVTIQEDRALIQGYIASTGGEPCEAWFEYGLTSAYGQSTPRRTKSGSGDFTENATGLMPGTEYHFRAAARNSAGTAYGEEMIFVTTGQPPAPSPSPSPTPSPSPSPSLSPSPSPTPSPSPRVSPGASPLPSPSPPPSPSPSPSPGASPSPGPSPGGFCEDGTPLGECSKSKPKYCAGGILKHNCTECGCPLKHLCFDGSYCFREEPGTIGFSPAEFEPENPRENAGFYLGVPVSSAKGPVENCTFYFDEKFYPMYAEDGYFDRADETAQVELSPLGAGNYRARITCLNVGGISSVQEFSFSVLEEKVPRFFEIVLCADEECSSGVESVYAGQAVFLDVEPEQKNVSFVVSFPDGREAETEFPGWFLPEEAGRHSIRFFYGEFGELESFDFNVAEKPDYSFVLVLVAVAVVAGIAAAFCFLWRVGRLGKMLTGISIGKLAAAGKPAKAVPSKKPPGEEYFVKWKPSADEGEFVCEECGKEFRSKKEFKEHKRYHSDLKQALGMLKPVSKKKGKDEMREILEEKGFAGEVVDRAAEMLTFGKKPGSERVKVAEKKHREKKAKEVMEELRKKLKEAEESEEEIKRGEKSREELIKKAEREIAELEKHRAELRKKRLQAEKLKREAEEREKERMLRKAAERAIAKKRAEEERKKEEKKFKKKEKKKRKKEKKRRKKEAKKAKKKRKKERKKKEKSA